MCRKLMFSIVVVTVLGLAGAAFAQDWYWWTGAGDGLNWGDEENWDPEGVPWEPNMAGMGWPPEQGPEISGDVNIGAIYGPSGWLGNTQFMEVEGDLVVNDWWVWADSEFGLSIIYIDHHPVITVNGEWIACAGESPAQAILNITDNAEIYVSDVLGGAFASDTSFQINMDEDAHVEVYGGIEGAFASDTSFQINMDEDAHVEVYGGIEGAFAPDTSFQINMSEYAYLEVSGEMEGAFASDSSFEINMIEDAYLGVFGDWLRGGNDPGSVFEMNISGNAHVDVWNFLRGGDNTNSQFLFDMSGGYVSCGEFRIGEDGGGSFDMSGGTLEAEEFELTGRQGVPITVNMTGGTVIAYSELRAPLETAGAGAITMNLNGGSFECGWFSHAGVAYHMDITEGTFIIYTDQTAEIQAGVAAGYITAYGGDGTVNVELVSGDTVVTAIPPDPNFASNPNPPDGAAVFTTDVNLSWTPGESAVKHDVYFGTDFDDVNQATDPNVLPGRGRQDSNSYYASGLELYKTYYWRIGEVNGPDPCMGRVWSFTVVEGYTNSLGMLFVRIPPGTFTMGYGNNPLLEDDGTNDYDEQPEHLVQISKEFYILHTRVVDTHYWQSGLVGTANDVSWNDANTFCEWLSNLEGKTYRLPTEAEWEFVCENPWGVQDMDEREWVQDWHRTYINDGQVDPIGLATGMLKVIRSDDQDRETLPPDAKSYWDLEPVGFRVVLESEPPDFRYVAPPAFTQAAVKQSTAQALQGPDPCIPYFTVRFAMPMPPENQWTVGALAGVCQSVCRHNHSPAFEIMPNGDALAVYFSAPSGENDDDVRFVQSRLRYGSDQWDLPTLFYDFKHMNDQSVMMWTEGSTVHFFGGGRITQDEEIPFKVGTSTDNGATWDIRLPIITAGPGSFTPQPCQNAFRAPNGDMYFAMDADPDDAESFLWRSTDNKITWQDMWGRTNGRHSTVVPLDDFGTILSLGGKRSDIGGWMPWCKSYDWGAGWWDEGPTVFPALADNQRPCVTRLANGNLVFVSDCQERDTNAQPPGWAYGYGCLVAISDDNGDNWHIRTFPVTLPHELDWEYGTLGYASVRQAPSGVIHVLTTMTHPCLHYEFNEEWITSGEGDIPPETSGGTVNDYNEYYPGGALRATWSARTCTNGRYLLDGTETVYYENGRMEYEAAYNNGRKTGTETHWGPSGVKLWSWEHNDISNMSVLRHWWSNGLKRIESNWENYPMAMAIPRNFSGLQATGPVYHWDRSGTPNHAYSFWFGWYDGEIPLAPPQTKDDIDLRTFAQNYLWRGMSGGEGYNEADLNKDGIVDLVDFAIFASQQP